MGSTLPGVVSSLGLSEGPPPAGSVESDCYIWAATASRKKAGQSPPQFICPPFLSFRPPLLYMLLWALRVFFSPAVLPELESHSISVKMM